MYQYGWLFATTCAVYLQFTCSLPTVYVQFTCSLRAVYVQFTNCSRCPTINGDYNMR